MRPRPHSSRVPPLACTNKRTDNHKQLKFNGFIVREQ